MSGFIFSWKNLSENLLPRDFPKNSATVPNDDTPAVFDLIDIDQLALARMQNNQFFFIERHPEYRAMAIIPGQLRRSLVQEEQRRAGCQLRVLRPNGRNSVLSGSGGSAE